MSAPSGAAPGAAPLEPGATIGILGGGQLARMLTLAAARLGLTCHIFCPENDAPALDVVREATIATYDDAAALAMFADAVDVATYEFENVPAETAALVARHVPLYPDARALAVTQDRLTEKTFLKELGLETAPFAAVEDRATLAKAIGQVGRPAILKTRRFGYDGKGQVTVREGLELDVALGMIGRQPAILEGFVPFACEVSVVAARGRDGAFAAYEVTENRHENHILRTSTVPAKVSEATREAALALARRIVDALGYVGVIGIELFVVRERDGRERLLVNEMAPRVHNSGHWTLDGALTSQFEQHVRAVAGMPLGATARLGARVEMTNILGEEARGWRRIAAEAGAHLHLYGKREIKPGRKMGHVTRILGD